MKTGYKTTEFWLSFIALLLGAVMASGLVAEGSQIAQVIGFGISILASLGYSTSRGLVKAAESKAQAVKAVGALNPTKPE